MRTIPLLVAALLATAAGAHAGEPAPNVVIVYADDLGYGDLSEHPEVVRELAEQLARIRLDGRSRP